MRPFRVGERLTQPRMEELRRLAEAQFGGAGFAGGNVPIEIRNESGADVDLGQILGIGGMDFAISDAEGTFLLQIILRGVTPDLDDHEFKYAVCLEPIADGAIGRCALDGLVRVRLNVIDEHDDYAIVDDAEVVLASHWFGNARIIAKETEAGSGSGSHLSTGEMWAVVRLNDPSEMKAFGQILGINPVVGGMSGTITVYKGDGTEPLQRMTGEGSAPLEDVTLTGIYHPPTDAESIPAGAWVQAERVADGTWVFDVQYCESGGS